MTVSQTQVPLFQMVEIWWLMSLKQITHNHNYCKSPNPQQHQVRGSTRYCQQGSMSSTSVVSCSSIWNISQLEKMRKKRSRSRRFYSLSFKLRLKTCKSLRRHVLRTILASGATSMICLTRRLQSLSSLQSPEASPTQVTHPAVQPLMVSNE